MARQGKIARLPHKLREQVNQRLLDGQPASTLLDWLNTEPEALTIYATHFDNAPANPQNLSEWRRGGYQDWLQRKQKTENLKTLSSYANDLAKAGGNLSDGAAAIAAGHVLEALENAATDEDADLSKLVAAVTSLKQADLAKARLKLDRRKQETKEKEVALSREKFELQTIKIFMKWAKSDAAQEILANGKPQHVQMDMLRKTIFGNRS